ncbi:Toxin A [Slackia heliotrinireducens]|uniref:Putative cell wall binding protein n=1 Tax=Slackia heliotrinireducens (strain ATCC 29202 / DSM 20476 / NCTC 11029 / RHS 1) TaxID=471855 RepID=C7N508_SLAHD|nr:N-acetylmuramoyl-L-alanine amidase family protein [Slackia heliotrinireducens]ACV21993.1 putative cell wall binding protein [Slackia heliotrinireducens DSM 20476]VEG99888.1 Toxin A [Slackia heliotrinireducens]
MEKRTNFVLHAAIAFVLGCLLLGSAATTYAYADEWKNESDGWHCYDDYGWEYADGVFWIEPDGAYYYFDANGVMQRNCWKNTDLGWMHFEKNGKGTNGWLKSGGKWYYCLDGMMSTGAVFDGTAWYFMGDDGVWDTTPGWRSFKDFEGTKYWTYVDTNGRIHEGWLKFGGKWYCIDQGIMATYWLWWGTEVDGSYYYMGTDGAMRTGWIKWVDENGDTIWSYQDSNGRSHEGWLKSGGKWYYCIGGDMVSNDWVKDGGKWYWFPANGVMQTGWAKIGGSWYYFSGGGVMQTGWQKISGSWYYLGTNGKMVTGTQTIGGKTYTFSSSGVWMQ